MALLSYPLIKLIGLCLAPYLELSANSIELECLNWVLRGISCASGGLSRLRHSCSIFLAPSALVFLCQLPRIESLTKTMLCTKKQNFPCKSQNFSPNPNITQTGASQISHFSHHAHKSPKGIVWFSNESQIQSVWRPEQHKSSTIVLFTTQ